jgi:hypothetical protein
VRFKEYDVEGIKFNFYFAQRLLTYDTSRLSLLVPEGKTYQGGSLIRWNTYHGGRLNEGEHEVKPEKPFKVDKGMQLEG